jgi:plasmid maintenance system antidote protein VapI
MENITFEVLQTRLLALVNTRIQNGEFTERGLARIMGISQSQIHNLLKGARKLHTNLADRFLIKFGISALVLLREGELDKELAARRGFDSELLMKKPARPSRLVAPGREEWAS